MTQQIHPIGEDITVQPEKKTSEDVVVIPVIEEKIVVDKKIIETGKVSIIKRVNEEVEEVNIPLKKEEVDVERVPINQYIETPPPAVRYEGDTMIIPVIKEVLIVEKRLLLVEEIHVKHKSIQTTEIHQVTLRKEEVLIERSQTGDVTVQSEEKKIVFIFNT